MPNTLALEVTRKIIAEENEEAGFVMLCSGLGEVNQDILLCDKRSPMTSGKLQAPPVNC
jgi:hypothetical protein